MKQWLKGYWHVIVAVVLAFGILGMGLMCICGPCGLLGVGLREVSEAAPTVFALGSPTATRSPTPTPTPVALGEFVTTEDGLEMAVTEYSISHTCPDATREAPQGAKFIVIQVRIENAQQDVAADIPHTVFMLLRNGNILTRDWEANCLYTEDSLGNACWEWGGKLYPGVRCEGWVVFEVPEGMNAEELVVDGPGAASWRLGP